MVSEVDETNFSEDFEMEMIPKNAQPAVQSPKSTDGSNIQSITSVTANWLTEENLAKADDTTWIDETSPVSFPPSANKGNILYFYWFDAYEDFKQLPGMPRS